MNSFHPDDFFFSWGAKPLKTTSTQIKDMKVVVFESGQTTEVCENDSIAEDMEQEEEAPLNIGFIWCQFFFKDTRISAFDPYPLVS